MGGGLGGAWDDEMTIPKLLCPGGGCIFTPKPPNFFSEAPKVVQIPEKKFLAEYVTRLIKFISKMRLNTKMYVGAEAGYGRPVDKGAWTATTVKRPRQQPAQPPIRQLLGAADTQTAHPATTSTSPAHQLLGSANAETTPARAPAEAADRTQRPDATCEGTNG